MYKAWIRATLEYRTGMLSEALPTVPFFLDRIQWRVIRLIDGTSSASTLQLLALRRLFPLLSFFYHNYFDFVLFFGACLSSSSSYNTSSSFPYLGSQSLLPTFGY